MAYDPSTNEILFQRVGNSARELQGARETAQLLLDYWFGEDVANSPDFLQVGSVTPAEITSMITLSQDLIAFFENGVVPQADRQQNLMPFIPGQ